MTPKKSDDPLSNQALGEAFLAFVDAAAARNPQRSWGPDDPYVEADLEAAEQDAQARLDEILAARKACRAAGRGEGAESPLGPKPPNP